MRPIQHGPYTLCGWRVFSELPLPELPPWSTTLAEQRALRLKLGGPPPLGESSFTASDEGTVILRVQEVAAFHMNAAGDQIVIEPEENADLLLVRAFLYGSVLALLCYKHGFLPLHGASVLMDDGAILLSGPIGAGKSTLATALARRGHPLLSDDVCVLDLGDPAHPQMWPAFPRVKLLPDAIDAFQLGAATTYSRGALGTKGHFGVATLGAPLASGEPVPIKAIYALAESSNDTVRHAPLKGKDAFTFLDSQVHRKWMGCNLGLGPQLFRQICVFAAAVPVYRLERPRDLSRLDKVVRLIEDSHRADRGPACSEVRLPRPYLR